ncbi:MAG TPA: anthrone oxygenase family protein [Mycobacterium sp.]|nr:anthrone oxygenase family protein [Mycobacterium sp.]
MTITHLNAWLMVVAGGLFSGGIFYIAVERLNLWQRMPVDQYVIDFRRSLYRADPLMLTMGMISELGAFVFALNSAGRPATLAGLGTTLIAAIMVSSIVIAEPINESFRQLPAGQQPERPEQLRIVWRRFHLARTSVALLSLACLAAATV